MHTRAIAAAAALTAALAAAPAQAHVTLQPGEVPAGGFTRLDVRVPNERDEAGTTKVAGPVPARLRLRQHRAEARLEDGREDAQGRGARRAARREVRPRGRHRHLHRQRGQRDQARASSSTSACRSPRPTRPGTSLTFKALQTYEGGEVVRWIGAPDGEEPAPQVALVAAEEEDGARRPRRAAGPRRRGGGRRRAARRGSSSPR